MVRFGSILGCLLMCIATALPPTLAAEDSEAVIRDRIENQFKVKAAVAKPGDGPRVIKDLFNHLQKCKDSPLECRIVLESIILIGTQDEHTLDLARTAAGMWIQAYKFPAVDCYDLYLNNLKTLRDRNRVDKDSAAIELVFLKNDEVDLFVQGGDYAKALKLAQENKAFADSLPDRDLKSFANTVCNEITRREKVDRRKSELSAALDPDADAPAANSQLANFLVLEAGDLAPPAREYMVKSADGLLTAFAKLLDAHDAHAPLGCRDLVRMGEIAYALSKKAATDDARESLLTTAETAFNEADRHPEAKTLVDAAKLPFNLYIEHNAQTKVAQDLGALRRRTGSRGDDATYLFSHVSFFAPIDRPLGPGWTYRKDQDHDWTPDGPSIAFIKGDGRLNCKTKLSGDFTLSFDLLPLTEFQDKNSTVFYGVYFNDGMRAGIQNTPKETMPRMLFDFGVSKSGATVTPTISGFTGWTRWEIRQKNGVVNVLVNGRAMFSNSVKSPNPIDGEFSFGSEPATSFKLRNIRLKNDN